MSATNTEVDRMIDAAFAKFGVNGRASQRSETDRMIDAAFAKFGVQEPYVAGGPGGIPGAKEGLSVSQPDSWSFGYPGEMPDTTYAPSKIKSPSGPTPIEAGNIDIHNRPVVKNADGSISTVRSISVGTDRGEVLIPTVSEDGRIMSNDEAIDQYRRTGRHLGIFKTPEDATSYALSLHQQQDSEYSGPRGLDTVRSIMAFKRQVKDQGGDIDGKSDAEVLSLMQKFGPTPGATASDYQPQTTALDEFGRGLRRGIAYGLPAGLPGVEAMRENEQVQRAPEGFAGFAGQTLGGFSGLLDPGKAPENFGAIVFTGGVGRLAAGTLDVIGKNVAESLGKEAGARAVNMIREAIENAGQGGGMAALNELGNIPIDDWKSRPGESTMRVLKAAGIGAAAGLGLGGVFGAASKETRPTPRGTLPERVFDRMLTADEAQAAQEGRGAMLDAANVYAAAPRSGELDPQIIAAARHADQMAMDQARASARAIDESTPAPVREPTPVQETSSEVPEAQGQGRQEGLLSPEQPTPEAKATAVDSLSYADLRKRAAALGVLEGGPKTKAALIERVKTAETTRAESSSAASLPEVRQESSALAQESRTQAREVPASGKPQDSSPNPTRQPWEMTKAIADSAVFAADPRKGVASHIEDWGRMPRGQGKRIGGMVVGAMSDAPRGKKTYVDPVGAFNLTKDERVDVGGLVGGQINVYSRSRAAGFGHTESMIYAETPNTGDRHRAVVEWALREGRPVPPEVLRDYPDLAAKAKPAETPKVVNIATASDNPMVSNVYSARQQREVAWATVKRLREEVRDLGPRAGNKRLELLKAERAHHDAVEWEKRAREAAEQRASEVGETTKRRPSSTAKPPTPAEAGTTPAGTAAGQAGPPKASGKPTDYPGTGQGTALKAGSRETPAKEAPEPRPQTSGTGEETSSTPPGRESNQKTLPREAPPSTDKELAPSEGKSPDSERVRQSPSESAASSHDFTARRVIDKPEPGEPQGPVTGGMNRMMEEDRKALGLDSFDSPERRTRQAAMDTAVATGIPNRALELAAEIHANPRPLTDVEEEGFLYRLNELRKQERAARRRRDNAKDEGQRMSAEVERQRIADEYGVVSSAKKKGGTETARGLGARDTIVDEEFNILHIKSAIKEYEASSGKTFPPEKMKELEALADRFEKLTERMEKAAQDSIDAAAESTLKRHAASKRGIPKEAREKIIVDLAANVRQLIESGCR